VKFADKGKIDILWTPAGLRKLYDYLKQWGFKRVKLYKILNINSINSTAASSSSMRCVAITIVGIVVFI
jgi:hypothetical protein